MSDAKKPAKDARGRFITGNIGGGRPRGARSKLGEEFLEALLTDWQQHGVTVIAKVREEKPEQYLRVVASIIPKEIEVHADGEQLEHLSDADLIRIIRAYDEDLAAHGFDLSALDGGDDRK
jgi:hypothetical protein